MEEENPQRSTCLGSLRSIRGHAVLVLVVSTLALFTDTYIYSSIVPYYPMYSRQYNLTDEEVGMFMATYSVTFVPFTPLAGMRNLSYQRPQHE